MDRQFKSLKTVHSISLGEQKGRNGSYGSVFSVKSIGTEQIEEQLICKRLHNILLGNKDYPAVSDMDKMSVVEKFKQECVFLSRLSHRNIVRFHSVHVGKDVGDISLIMEALSLDLYTYAVNGRVNISYIRKVAVLRDVSCGLEYLHMSKIMHRDLNAGNVLLSHNFLKVKIADLGCSRLLHPDDISSNPLSNCPGALDFMPPEAANTKGQDAQYDFKIDCFSFGHLALFLWNRRMPSVNSNVEIEDVQKQHQQISRRKSSFFKLENHPELKDIITRCLLDISHERPSSREILHFFNKKMEGSSLLHHSKSSIKMSNQVTVAVDFGTSGLTVAYRLGNGDLQVFPLHEEHNSSSIPNVVLTRRFERTGKLKVEIGQRALNLYHQLASTMTDHVYYTIDLKVYKDHTIEGSDGKTYQLADVIAHIFTMLRAKVWTYFNSRKLEFSFKRFHWVISISAACGNNVKKALKEAASEAGLLMQVENSSGENCLGKKRNITNFSFIHKSDASAKGVFINEISTIKQHISCSTSNPCFIVADIAEGSIEVSAFAYHNRDECAFFPLPSHNFEGGRLINEAFLKFLAEVVCDKNLSRYFDHQEQLLHNAEFRVMFLESFKRAKIHFASSTKNNSYFSIKLPPCFFEVYESELKIITNTPFMKLGKHKRSILISYSKFESFMTIFLSNIYKAIQMAYSTATSSDRSIAVIFLVGEMGGCEYIFNKVCSWYGNKTRVIVPDNYLLATVHGACHYFDVLPHCLSKETYGIGCSVPYNESDAIHQHGEKLLNEDDSCFCSSFFVPLVKKNEHIDPNVVYQCVLNPMHSSQSVMMVSLYSTTADNPSYVLDVKTGNVLEGVTKLATLNVDIESGMNTLSLHERQVRVDVIFQMCEITITAEYNNHGEVSTTV